MPLPQPTTQKPAYPPDWSIIASRVKQDRHWTCQHCGIIQGEDLHNNITVHHKDHDTFNNDPDNLLVLCQKRHLYLEADCRLRQHLISHINHQLRLGQRILPGFAELLYTQQNNLSYRSPAVKGEPGL